jgi:hypothetical protein
MLPPAKWGTSMQKVIAYQDRAEEWRRRASEVTKPREREADERMAAVWESLARMREKQLKEGITRPKRRQGNRRGRAEQAREASRTQGVAKRRERGHRGAASKEP